VKAEEYNTLDIKQEIESLTGVTAEKLEIAYEIKNGYIVRILVYTDDKQSADNISEAITQC